MPEGPTIVILKEETARFEGQHIVAASGNTSGLDPDDLPGQPILRIRSFGKQFLIELPISLSASTSCCSAVTASTMRKIVRPGWR